MVENLIPNLVKIEKVKSNSLKLSCVDPELFNKIRSKFAWKNPGCRYIAAYRMGLVDGYQYCINKSGVFNTGLLKNIVKQINDYGYSIEYDKETTVYLKASTNKGCIVDKNILPNKSISLRDYQVTGVEAMSNNLRCIVKLPTASGKSAVITAFILHCIRDNKPWKYFIVLVPTKSLVEQFRDDMVRDYGLPKELVGVLYSEDKTWDGSQKILISTRDSMNLRKDICEKLKGTLCILINDECHTTKSDMTSSIIERIDPAAVIGLTGTMPTDPYDYHCVVGNNGPVEYEEKTVDLQESGYLPNCIVKVCKIELIKGLKGDWDKEKHDIRHSNIWGSRLMLMIKQRVNNGKNCLVLVHHELTGDILKMWLDKYSVDCVFFSGNNSSGKGRQKYRSFMEENHGKVIIATYGVYSTGISIKNLQTLFLTEHAPGACTLIQSVGRLLRNHKSKEIEPVEIIDIYTNLHYSNKHKQVRKRTYDSERYNYEDYIVNKDGTITKT